MAPEHSRLLPPPSPRVSKAATTGPVAAQVDETMRSRERDDGEKTRQLRCLPPISGGGGGARAGRRSGDPPAAAAIAEPAARAAKAWMRQALAKRVATRMLRRSTAAAAAADEPGSWRVLACCCPRLPAGLRCALHQAGAPGRSWIVRAQRRGGGEPGEAAAVAVAVAPPRACGGWAFCQYARWRRHVWMPSRFYLERVQPELSNGFLHSREFDACSRC